jgi:hypothetical protein
MSRDDIIRMAREAGSIDSEDVIETVYAAFSAAAVRETSAEYRLGWNDGVMMEREACAKVCDEHAKRNYNWASENADIYHAQAHWAGRIAAAIRARGQE